MLFPHGEAVALTGAGHYPWLDDTETFGDALLAALRG
jgi:pimeloyl-ACP methyl ester carboxylesterase